MKRGFAIAGWALRVVVLVLGAWTNPAAAQSGAFSFERFSIEQGLSHGAVRAILQDHDGYMWIGTEDGLNRYDGLSFAWFRTRPGDSTSLSSNFVQALMEDREGRLWVGTGRGLNLFDSRRLTFRRFLHEPGNPSSISDHQVESICETADGDIWVGTHDGLNRFDAGQGVFVRDHAGEIIYSLVTDGGNGLWYLGSMPVAGQADKISRTLYHRIPGQPAVVLRRDTSSIPFYFGKQLALHRDSIWIVGPDGGVIQWDWRSGKAGVTMLSRALSPVTGHAVTIFHISLLQDSLLWIGSDDGVFQINMLTHSERHIVSNGKDPKSLAGNVVFTVAEDRSGVLWFGDASFGLSKFAKFRTKFGLLRHDQWEANTLSNSFIRGIWVDKSGILWVGTQYGGLNRVDRATRSVRRFQYSPATGGPIMSNKVWALFQDSKGVLWIGCKESDHLYFVENTAKPVFREFRHDSLLSGVQAVMEDRTGRLWLGTEGHGVVIISADRKLVTRYYETTISADRRDVQSIFQDSKGRVWMGTGTQLLMAEDDRETPLREYEFRDTDPRSVGFGLVACVMQSRDGSIWVATKGGGLSRYDEKEGKFDRFTEADGLAHDNCYGIVEDAEGILWISTDNGLSRFDRQKRQFRNYGVADGLQGREYNRSAYHRSQHGEIFFGGTNGLNFFNPSEVLDNPVSPQVHLTTVQTTDSIFRGWPDRGLTLSYSQNYLRFEFVGLEYTAPEQNSFSWTLKGFDSSWTPASTRREATYTNLDPGEYVFMVRGSNSDGVWSPQVATVALRIDPAFWNRWWFRLGVLVAIIGLAVGLVRQRLTSLERQKQDLERKVEARTEELRSTMDELKRAQVQLVQSAKLDSLANMVAGLAHEINNPLTFVHSNLQLLHERIQHLFLFLKYLHERYVPQVDDSAERARVEKFKRMVDYDSVEKDVEDMFRSATEGSTRILNIVKRLRLFSSAEFQGLRETDLNMNLSIVIELLMRKQTHVPIETEFGALPKMVCHVAELNQAFINILENAVDAVMTAEKGGLLKYGDGRVVIRTEYLEDQKALRVTISDNGVGMTAAVRARIFDPFFTTKRVGEGAGLGLAETFGIIQKHHGTIDVRSREKEGSEFSIRLPITTSFPVRGMSQTAARAAS